MDGRSRRYIDMGASALVVSQARPDTDAGYNVSVAKLEELVARARQAARRQREAQVDIRTSSEQKRSLRKAILGESIRHLAQVGRTAAREHPELGKSFQLKPGAETYLALLTAARSMQAAAEAAKEVLAKYGLSESVLARFGQMLDQFEAAITLGKEGRTALKGATLDVRTTALQIAQTVRVMDTRNRQRFADDPQALGSWLSAKRVLGAPKASGGPEPGGSPETPAAPAAPGSGTADGSGDVRPAA